MRTATRPRWLALLAVVLLAATGMALLGQWQLNRARESHRGAEQQVEQTRKQAAPTPLEQVITPRQTFPKAALGTRVSATGDWDGDRRLLVTGRELGGRDGYWVLVPLRLPDGSAVPVVRGWVASADDPAAAGPVGTGVQVTGLLQPSEPPVARAPGEAEPAAGLLERVAVTELVNRWPYPLITGFVVQQAQSPATGPVPAVVPPPRAETGLDLQNLSYAIQWWLFAGLGLLLWWRLVRDDHRGRLPGGAPSPGHSSSLSAVPQPDRSPT